MPSMPVRIGILAGAAWSMLVVWIGASFVNIPVFSRVLVEPFFFLVPGLVILAMILRVAGRRHLKAEDGAASTFDPGSGADIDRRVLQNTVEQAVLAICLWTPISFLLPEDGLGVVIALSVSFGFARAAFWYGMHHAAPLRAFGFVATIGPTILALVWGVVFWAT